VSAQPGGESKERFIIEASEEHGGDPQQCLPSTLSLCWVSNTPREKTSSHVEGTFLSTLSSVSYFFVHAVFKNGRWKPGMSVPAYNTSTQEAVRHEDWDFQGTGWYCSSLKQKTKQLGASGSHL
jgi:hypothetical protein